VTYLVDSIKEKHRDSVALSASQAVYRYIRRRGMLDDNINPRLLIEAQLLSDIITSKLALRTPLGRKDNLLGLRAYSHTSG
jgi:hypothetical protein